MSNTDSIVNAIKKEMMKLRPKPRKNLTRKIIDDLVDDIYAQLKDGNRLEDVYEIVRKKLPAENKMSLGTFKQYWRDARDAAGLPKIKNSGRKRSPQKFSDHANIKSNAKKYFPLGYSVANKNSDTSSDFRADPDDI